MKKGFKFRIAPDKEQIELLNKTFGCTRFTWNSVLAKSIKDYKAYIDSGKTIEKPSTHPKSLAYHAAKLKKEYEFLKEVSSVALQQTLMDLGNAFSGLFNGKGHPKFKKKQSRQSFRLQDTAFVFKDGEFYIAKCKTPIKVFWSRELPSKPKSVTISREPCGEYYASFVCEYTPTRQKGTGITGIDLGLKDLVITSEGDKVDNPKVYRQYQKKLRRLQKSLSRKKKGSNNRAKAKLKVVKLHKTISNIRKDYTHKLTTKLVSENQAIGLESLNVKGMVKNSRLAKSLHDASLGEISRQLVYKTQEAGSLLVKMDTWFPSTQLCSYCGTKPATKLKLSDRMWECTHCQTTHDRDINASVNMKKVVEYTLKENPKTNIVIARKYSDLVLAGVYR